MKNLDYLVSDSYHESKSRERKNMARDSPLLGIGGINACLCYVNYEQRRKEVLFFSCYGISISSDLIDY